MFGLKIRVGALSGSNFSFWAGHLGAEVPMLIKLSLL